ncbi:hypothetical protein [Roseivirga echinicomitans]|uniref:hypothetical protein n=1 Tax=Roseivirga echinicomitans TaxID=296218 RepID=UPI0012FD8820|nr:hypothetical protein [Roseivirga echinicomitans]
MIAIFFVAEKALDAQSSISGTYRSYFGEKLELRSDSTFSYSRSHDLASQWATGIWHEENGFIELKVVPIFDTIRISGSQTNSIKDSLVMSDNQQSSLISLEDHTASLLTSRHQTLEINFSNLFTKGDRLFHVKKNGHLSRKRVRRFLSRKRPSYFFRVKD